MKREYYLKNDREFERVYKKRKTFGNRNFTLYVDNNDLPYSRVGFSISKKVGKAVVRNKIKRQLRELYRLNRNKIKPGYDFIFVVKSNVSEISFTTLESAFLHILRISHLLKR